MLVCLSVTNKRQKVAPRAQRNGVFAINFDFYPLIFQPNVNPSSVRSNDLSFIGLPPGYKNIVISNSEFVEKITSIFVATAREGLWIVKIENF